MLPNQLFGRQMDYGLYFGNEPTPLPRKKRFQTNFFQTLIFLDPTFFQNQQFFLTHYFLPGIFIIDIGAKFIWETNELWDYGLYHGNAH